VTRCVAVIGPGDGATDSECATARAVGKLLAQHGFNVVCGGLGGVMAAVAEGVSDAEGLSIGILPTKDRRGASRHLSVVIPTGLGELRNGLVVGAAEGVIAIGGSWGTLSELALAKRLGLPVVSVGGWSVVDSAGSEVAVEQAISADAAVARLVELL
jgi:uncharacterized protein (TIGR00725 family)